jgi:nucleotide sugar dehydrogenase
MIFNELKSRIDSKELEVSVFGLGRIGLPTALMFTKAGYSVNGVDIDKGLLEDLQEGDTFVDEPGLPELLDEALEKGLIEFTSDFQDAIRSSDILIICVPTPVSENKVPDYSAIRDISLKIGNNIKKGQIVICESSISPTTIRDVIIPTIENNSNLTVNTDFGVCSCPERADPGKIIDNFNKVTRIVGGSSQKVGDLVIKLYESITDADIIQLSTPGTANAVKLTENIFRDVNIALMNELAVLYEKLDIDIKEVIKGASTKYNFQPHYPGPGVGGPCLPANPYYVIQDADKKDYIPFLIRVAREVNDRMPTYVLDLVTNALNFVGKSIKGTNITCLGLSYKANVRDTQISPAVKIVNLLKKKKSYKANLKETQISPHVKNSKITIYDPYYKGETVKNIKVAKSLEEAISNTECIVLLTDHDEFKDFDFTRVEIDEKDPLVLVDSRNIYDFDQLPENVVYSGVGRRLRLTK